ncbi:translation initiation factor eIF-2A [Cryphonectria parasitica EP155]|uniref:Eukaryotic translation initiation factor 2A n=1 Tax=Cryphonectria parasitica (strain ATCC 38755 / EP155) TaxID=660469 RepID=A0A9P5CNC8_CRYP1|nr:translation initiation factor eIF-2A [Cryphonectria parasitica EP155]KAF3763775.1 translation initiation factor eIF-2A [Cryphonectria parasitica EP155]
MANLLQFAYRTQKAVGLFNAGWLDKASASPAPTAGEPAPYSPVPGFDKYEGNSRCCVYSPCGRYFAWASNDGVSVIDATTGNVVTSLPGLALVNELGFSPLGTFLTTLERPSKDEAGDATKNLKIWRIIEDLPEGTAKAPLGQFVQKSQNEWNLQYTADEQFCARLVTNEVQFYQSHDLKTVWNKLRVEGVSGFALAAGSSHNVAVFVPERKGQPATVKVFNVPQFASPISQKTFFKGDKVQLKWNLQGSSLIVLAQTDVDKSNKSYYGETTLYMLSANGDFDARITLDKEGPIHDVSWSPTGREFGVVYGYMPAKTTVFNHRAVAQRSFPLGPRNTITFSPTGRFVLVAGFGNLAGQIDVYDLSKDYRKVCTIESGNPSVCQWSPDSTYIMTATTSPRLRVDNGVKLWHVGGRIMYNQDMDELYNITWRPVPADQLPKTVDPLAEPEPHESAKTYLSTVKTPSKPVGAYRPPGARGSMTPLHFKREDEGGAAHVMSNGGPAPALNGFGRARRQVPGAELSENTLRPSVPGAEAAGDENLSKTALKNKKKRGNKKAKDVEGQAPGNNNNHNSNESGLAPPPQGYGSGSGGEDGHRDRRGGHQNNNNNNNHSRSHSRRPAAPAQTGETPAANPAQSANAKKMRSLQKKLRAIEDLEFRLKQEGAKSLEVTQLNKIASKDGVLKDIDKLEAEMQKGQ